jgi:Flp pilus assembly protein TadD
MLGRSEEALAMADARLRRAPTDVDALLIRALALRIATRFWEAEGAYTELVRLAPDKAHGLTGRAAARAAAGDEDGARADLAMLAARPGEPDAFGHAMALYTLRDFQAAMTVIEAGLARPDLPRHQRSQLLPGRPLLHEALGEAEEALREVDALLRDRPDEFGLHELRALVLIDLGRAEEAVTSAKRALAAAPRHPELLETLGVAERFSGQAGNALTSLVAAATARPELPRGRAELAACFAQLGRVGEAESALESLPKWSERDPFVVYARACLAGLRGDTPEMDRRLADAGRIRPGLARRAAVDPILRSQTDAHAHEPSDAVTLANDPE